MEGGSQNETKNKVIVMIEYMIPQIIIANNIVAAKNDKPLRPNDENTQKTIRHALMELVNNTISAGENYLRNQIPIPRVLSDGNEIRRFIFDNFVDQVNNIRKGIVPAQQQTYEDWKLQQEVIKVANNQTILQTQQPQQNQQQQPNNSAHQRYLEFFKNHVPNNNLEDTDKLPMPGLLHKQHSSLTDGSNDGWYQDMNSASLENEKRRQQEGPNERVIHEYLGFYDGNSDSSPINDKKIYENEGIEEKKEYTPPRKFPEISPMQLQQMHDQQMQRQFQQNVNHQQYQYVQQPMSYQLQMQLEQFQQRQRMQQLQQMQPQNMQIQQSQQQYMNQAQPFSNEQMHNIEQNIQYHPQYQQPQSQQRQQQFKSVHVIQYPQFQQQNPYQQPQNPYQNQFNNVNIEEEKAAENKESYQKQQQNKNANNGKNGQGGGFGGGM